MTFFKPGWAYRKSTKSSKKIKAEKKSTKSTKKIKGEKDIFRT